MFNLESTAYYDINRPNFSFRHGKTSPCHMQLRLVLLWLRECGSDVGVVVVIVVVASVIVANYHYWCGWW